MSAACLLLRRATRAARDRRLVTSLVVLTLPACSGRVWQGTSERADPPATDAGVDAGLDVDAGPEAVAEASSAGVDAGLHVDAGPDAVADASSESGPASDPCSGWTEDTSFSTLSSQGFALGRVYGAWASSENDIHVALGVEDASWPSGHRIAAVAHWNGSAWAVDPLPPTGAIAAISGTAADDLWVLSTDNQQTVPQLLRNRGPGQSWTPFTWPAGYGAGFDLVVLGPESALLSARDSYNLVGPTPMLELVGGAWMPTTFRSQNDALMITNLYAVDAQHVYGLGYTMVSPPLLEAFDGQGWSSTVSPTDVVEVVGTPNAVYASSRSNTDGRLYSVSTDLATWTQVANVNIGSDSHGLAVTSRGTVVAVFSNYMTHSPAGIIELRGGVAASCTLSIGLAMLVAVSPPGGPFVHVFSGEQAGSVLHGAHHWVKRADP